jgi:AraC-like DNA-binding protein
MRRVGHMLDEARRGLRFEPTATDDIVGRIQTLPALGGDAQLVALLGILCELSHMASVRSLASAGYEPSLRLREQQRIDRVCGYLHEHFTENIEQAKISRMLRMNPAAFSRFFKRATGRTMTAYVNELRLGLAARLLIETNLNVLEVCYRAGFNNAANFHRQFARLKGCSPGQFRRRYEMAAGSSQLS